MNRIGRFTLVTLLAMLALSCSDSTPTSPSSTSEFVVAKLGEPFEVPVSGTAVVQPEGMIVTFRAVETDSRCATDVTCVWEGEGILNLRLRLRESQGDYRVSTNRSEGNKVHFQGMSVEVVELLPHPKSTDGPVESRPYRATLIVDNDD